jgi:4-hydroxybenzoate polyprenyltransferase
MSVLVVLTVFPAWLLITEFEIGHMHYYFYACIAALMVFLIILWRSDSRKHYLLLHNILKLIIVLGVFSILLIDIDLVLNRFV